MKALFEQGSAITFRMVFFVVLSIILMTMDHRQNHLEKVRSALSLVVYPLQWIVDLPRVPLQWAGESLTSRAELEAEVERLRTQEMLLKAQQMRLVALEAENRRLRELSSAAQRLSDEMIIAEMLSVDIDPFSRHVIINKGSRNNIVYGQPVLDAEGIMGQVVHVGPYSSDVMLITDPSHAVPVQISRNGLRTLAVGTGASNELGIAYIPNTADVQVGDLLISSGLGGRFPSGYPVARVISVDINPNEPYAKVVAEPTAQLDRSREVLLVKSGLSLRDQPSDPTAVEETK